MLQTLKKIYNRYEYSDADKREHINSDFEAIKRCYTLSFALCFLHLFVAYTLPNGRYDGYLDAYVYYPILIVLTFVGYIVSHYRSFFHKEETIRYKSINIHLCVLIFMGILCFDFVYSILPYDAVAFFIFSTILTLMYSHIHPLHFAVYIGICSLFSVIKIRSVITSFTVIFDWITLIIILIFLAFFLNKKEKTISKEKNNLKEELASRKQDIDNQFIEYKKLQENVIYSMANLVENRDSDTGNHVKRTAYFVNEIAKSAKEMGFYKDELTSERIELITKAAPMHDIGKIVIPDSILKAPRRLTNEEFEIMKTHTTEGARVIEHVFRGIESTEYIKIARNITKYHHEKWNGKGYPEGLQKNEIPISARIMSIADVFDALVSKRCYKDEFPLSEAFEIINKDSGIHFDPLLVKAFMAKREEIINTIVNDFSL